MDESNFVEVMPSEIKPKDKRFEKMNIKFLPELPSTFLILGGCGSGKSSLLWSLLSKGYVYKSKKGKVKSLFDEMLIFLGTLDGVSSFEKIPVPNKLILTEFEPVSFQEYQNELQAHQMERLEKGKPMLNSCIVFDDFFGANLMKKAKVNGAAPIEKLCLTSRHLSNCTIFYLSQAYKNSGFASPAIRANITTLIVCKMAHAEILKIAEEYSEQYSVEEWVEHYDRAMAAKKFAFVVFDRRRPMNKDRWTIGFTIPFPPSKKSLQFAS